jgi:hypothetical protein
VIATLIVGPAVLVVVALFLVMWREHRSAREAAIAAIAGAVLAVWATLTALLASRGVFLQPDSTTVLPVGVALVVVIAGLTLSLVSSASLRRLLTNQRNLIRLNVWRLVGLIFLLLMAQGQMPALWALPAGIGDVLVGATAFWVAGQLAAPGGVKRALIYNWFGLADLVVAVGLGIITSPGPTRVFHTTPTSELATDFPLVLVPAFLVPLAFTLHVISLWQLFGLRWANRA